MPFDHKKEYKEFYMPEDKPFIVTVLSLNYIAAADTMFEKANIPDVECLDCGIDIETGERSLIW